MLSTEQTDSIPAAAGSDRALRLYTRKAGADECQTNPLRSLRLNFFTSYPKSNEKTKILRAISAGLHSSYFFTQYPSEFYIHTMYPSDASDSTTCYFF